MQNKPFVESQYFTPVFVALVFIAVVLCLIWGHANITGHMTGLEYQVAEEMGIRQNILEDREKLKIEYASLKSPQRIESIATNRLQMHYPGKK